MVKRGDAETVVPLDPETRSRLLARVEDVEDLDSRIRELEDLPRDQAVAILRTLRELECERYRPRVECLKRIAEGIRERAMPAPSGEEME